jgi:selenocysteine-specific elongation factor
MPMTDRAHWVIGTAGHVDHGKTSLVLALTGTDCDRLPEEKARGITTDLGFAHWQLGVGRTASVVDVPGHERFVRTMVAGSAGLDAVLLAVAADDGVMPQTREHVAIGSMLGVRAGVVALTKADLVDADGLARCERAVRVATRGTFLEQAEIVACSTRSGVGLDRLADTMLRVLPRSAEEQSVAPAFLPIDRVFHKAGAGLVVTGTLLLGALSVGDDVDVMAGGEVERAKVRLLQVHGRSVDQVHAPTRVAVNLRGAPTGLARGSVIAASGWQRPTRAVNAAIELLADAPVLRGRLQLVLHVGAAQRAVKAQLLGAPELQPSERGLVRLSASEPFAAFAGQHVVVRCPDRPGQGTVGGGTIVDPHPARRRIPVESWLHGDPRVRAEACVAEAKYLGTTQAEIVRRLRPEEDARAAVASLVKERTVRQVGEKLFLGKLVEEAKRAVRQTLAQPEHDGSVGLAKGELTTRAPVRLRGLVDTAVNDLVVEGAVVLADGAVRVAGQASIDGAREDACARAASRYAREGLMPASDEQIRGELGLLPKAFADALRELKRRGVLVGVGGMHFSAAALDGLKKQVASYFEGHPSLVPGDLKTMCGLTRKHAIPLLEWLDAQGITRREGDRRVAGPWLRSLKAR